MHADEKLKQVEVAKNRQAADTLKQSGNEALKQKDYSAAITRYTNALALDPKNHVLLANRSAAHIALEDWKAAESDAELCVKISSGYVKGYFRLASAQLEQGRARDAAKTVQKGLKLEAGDKSLAKLYRRAKEVLDAEKEAKERSRKEAEARAEVERLMAEVAVLKKEKAEKAALAKKRQDLEDKNTQQRREREKREAEEQSLAAGDGDLYSMVNKLTAGNPRAARLFAGRERAPAATCQLPSLLESFDLAGVAKLINAGKAKKIVVLTGQLLSQAAGVPSIHVPKGCRPHAALTKDLLDAGMKPAEYGQLFDSAFFRLQPKPFFAYAKHVWPGLQTAATPTAAHRFVRLLNERGLLLRVLTENVDSLEVLAGVPREKVVHVNGHFYSAACINCRHEANEEEMERVRQSVRDGVLPMCTHCAKKEIKGLMKPGVIFTDSTNSGFSADEMDDAAKARARDPFQGLLPEEYHTSKKEDMAECDLLIIIGTPLRTIHFASLIGAVKTTCPRLLINPTEVGVKHGVGESAEHIAKLWGLDNGLLLNSKENYRDAAWIGTCDDGTSALVQALGWPGPL
jgi:NAD-dependent SIR2 family protein deacetylase